MRVSWRWFANVEGTAHTMCKPCMPSRRIGGRRLYLRMNVNGRFDFCFDQVVYYDFIRLTLDPPASSEGFMPSFVAWLYQLLSSMASLYQLLSSA